MDKITKQLVETVKNITESSGVVNHPMLTTATTALSYRLGVPPEEIHSQLVRHHGTGTAVSSQSVTRALGDYLQNGRGQYAIGRRMSGSGGSTSIPAHRQGEYANEMVRDIMHVVTSRAQQGI